MVAIMTLSSRGPRLSPLPLTLALVALVVLAGCTGDTPTQPQMENGLVTGAAASTAAASDAVPDRYSDELDPSDIEYDGETESIEHNLRAPNGVELVFRFAGKVRAREPVTVTLRARADGDPVKGEVTVDFGDDRPERTFDIDRKAELTHTYREEGRFRIFAIVEAEDGRTARGGFRMRIREALKVDLEVKVAGGEAKPGEEVQLLFEADPINDEARAGEVQGSLTVDYGDGTSDFIKNFDGVARRKHVYEEEKEYTITLVLETDDGRSFPPRKEKVEISDAPPTGDEFDLSQATIMGNAAADIASWAVTSQVTGTRVSPSQICIFHTKAGKWPVWKGVEGNPWVVANIGGKWYAGTYEWVRPGQTCKGITAGNIGPHIKFPPMASWRPQKGEVVYLFMSTLARLGARSTNERSNLVRVVWPY